MRIPLVANAYGENLLMTVNKKLLRQPLPFKPYLIAEKPNHHLTSTDIKMTRIPDNIEVTMFKMEADTVQLNDDKAKQLMMEGKSFSKLPYLEQLYVDMPDYMLQHPNTDALDVLYLDIEVLTKGDGIFPRAHNRPIIAIGCKHNNNPVQIFDRYTRGNDSGLLEDFLDYYRRVDPDVIVTYNGHSFDLPYIIQRMEKHDIELDQLGRYGKFRYKEGQEDIEFNGRVHLDCIVPARKDQSLFGIKSRGLKDVSAWYGFKALSLGDDVTNTQALIGTPQLREYLESDVNATKVVSDVYLPNAIALAELVQVPLSAIVGCFPSFIPKMICARHCKRLNLVPLDANKDRYGNIKEDEDGKPTGEVEPGRLYTLGSRFEGAIVNLMKTGYIKELYKVDFSSYYPSAIRTWNLGPDTTRITNVRDYTGKYNFYRQGKTMILDIPDKNFNKNIEITVDMSKVGFLKEEIEKLTTERKRLKQLLKESKTKAETDAYDSRQIAIKVINNSIFGMLGSPYSAYGDMSTSLAITGMCRWVSTYVLNILDNSIVETDSVTGNTPIYLQHKHSKKLRITQISDLHLTNNIRNHYNGDYLIYTRNGWKEIIYTKKHNVTKNIHRISVSDGYVDVTQDHSLFNINKEEIKSSDIISKHSEIELCFLPLNCITDEEESDEFCWLIGFLLAEGSVYSGKTKKGVVKHQVSFNGNNKKLMLKVKKLANKVFGKRFKTKFELHDTLKSSAVYKVQGGYNKNICNFLKDSCYCLDLKTKRVPDFILNGTISKQKAFLDGLMIGDGYKTTTKSGQRIYSLDSIFKSLAAGVRYILQNLGELTTCSTRKDKLNVTRISLRFKRNKYKKLNHNLVLQNNIISNKDVVYDVSTEDGTFVNALGDMVLHNTDGFIVDRDQNVDEINAKIAEYIKDNQGVTSYMLLEKESIVDGFFYKMKNYAVRMVKKGKTIIIKHGVAFKSSKQAAVCDTIMDTVCQMTLDRQVSDTYTEAMKLKKLSQYPLSAFKFRVTFSKDLAGYKNGMSLHRAIGLQVEDRLKTKVEDGLQVDYYVTKQPAPCESLQKAFQETKRTKGPYYTISQYVTSPAQLDENYYQESIDKLFAIFGWDTDPQIKIKLI